jgi:cephalosporin-C deacetylase-like acetyl esterase
MNTKPITSVLLLLFISSLVFSQNIQNSVFSTSRWKDKKWLAFQDNHQALYRIITNEAFRMLDERSERLSELKTNADWVEYQKEARINMRSTIGKFSKTPLNARTTGFLDRETFTVEKILFESHPGFYVTSCLFIPKNLVTPAPTVIYCAGHTDLGFRSETYQRVILNLVEKGFIVFAFDPIGQGERIQYIDPKTAKSKIGGPTTEHSYAGVQTLLTGTSLADYFVWDGIRAIDYLETRNEVDMKRLGVTGRSGGGLQSALLMAYDDRIYAAAPECYITTFKRLLQSIGPQDAEQNPYHFISKGFDIPDFLHLHAPKPALIITTTHDFFSIQGARESYSEAKMSYSALGASANIQMVEDMGVHESTRANREELYAFFQKHLALPGDKAEIDVVPFSVEELQVTSTGQVSTSLNSETVFGLNKTYLPKTEKQLVNPIICAAGVELNINLTSAVYTGKLIKDEITIEKYFLENKNRDYALPLYLIKSEFYHADKVLIWLHPDGKGQVGNSEFLNNFLKMGYIILAPDLPGIGELYDPGFRGDGFVNGIPFNYTFGANLIGKSIPGIQAEALGILLQFVEKDERFLNFKINALVEGAMNTTFLQYGLINNPFAKVVFFSPVESDLIFIQEEYYDPSLAFHLVPGNLPVFDFSVMVSFLDPSLVKIVNPVKGFEIISISSEGIRSITEFLK